MSGGTYDYAYVKIDELADAISEEGQCSCASPATRRAFKAFLHKVAAACRAIEWNDSSDGDSDEHQLLSELLPRGMVLEEAVKAAMRAKDELEAVIKAAQAAKGPKS